MTTLTFLAGSPWFTEGYESKQAVLRKDKFRAFAQDHMLTLSWDEEVIFLLAAK